MDDRGPNDLERIIDDKDKIITHLRHDNKTLAREVSDLIEEKKQLLDNQSKKWYNIIMKNIMIAFLVLCFTTSVGNTNENNIINKITTHISTEVQDIKEFQKKNWEEGKIQTAKNIAMIKSWFVKN